VGVLVLALLIGTLVLTIFAPEFGWSKRTRAAAGGGK